MVGNVGMNSAAVSLLMSYNNNQMEIDKVQNAVSTGYDINKASDNPLLYATSQNLKNQANAYDPVITKIAQYKTSFDKLQANIQNISGIAAKIRDTISNLTSNSSYSDQTTAATAIKQYMLNIESLIQNSTDSSTGIGLNTNKKITLNIAPNSKVDLTNKSLNSVGLTMTYASSFLDIGQMLTGTSATLPLSQAPAYSSVRITWNGKELVADLGTATHRATFLTSVSAFINTNIASAATNAGVFSNSLDSQLQMMRTNQSGLNAQADALTKTDLTADSAKSAALQTQQQLLTSLLSMSNQRMQTVLGLFR
jgi:flagellin